jgi:cell division septal protein FtsQ
VKEVAKPYRNQRVSRPQQRSQEHLLEVSVRASKAREQRLRKAIGFVFKLTLLVVLLAGAWLGAREAVQRFFWDNPTLFLTDIRVDTDGTLTRDQILSAAGVHEGRNIFKTDLAGARSALNKLPQIQRVEIQRTLPNRLDIGIIERQPIAWVVAPGDTDPSASDRSFLVDARGYVMKSRKLLPEYQYMPTISGVETENLVNGQKVTTIEMQAALDLLRLNPDVTRWRAVNIDLSKGYCLVVTDRNGAQITFGLDRIDAQIARLYRLLDYVQPTQQEIRTVNLFVERNTPVTFYEPKPVVSEEEASPEKAVDAVPKAKSTAEPSKEKPKLETKIVARSTPSTKKATVPSKSSSSRTKSSSAPARKSVESLKKPFRM